jgi:hypothetical protein
LKRGLCEACPLPYSARALIEAHWNICGEGRQIALK